MLRLLGVWLVLATVGSDAPGLTLVLRVEGQTTFTAYHDEPLSFSVSISDRTLSDDWAWNFSANAEITILAADFKAGRISQEEYRKETERLTKGLKVLKVVTVGSEQSPWYKQMELRISGAQKAWPAALVLKHPDTPALVFDEKNNYVTAEHATTPEQMLQLEPGSYRILISLGGMDSNPVDVTVLPEKITEDVAKTEEMRMKLGRFYQQLGDGDKALMYADALLKENPLRIGALVLRGEGYILKKNWKAALQDFEKALALVIEEQRNKPELEPPEYIEATIDWLKKQK